MKIKTKYSEDKVNFSGKFLTLFSKFKKMFIVALKLLKKTTHKQEKIINTKNTMNNKQFYQK